MRRNGFAAPYGSWAAGFAFALAVTLIIVVIALTHVGVANAQTQPKKSGSGGQYAKLVAPSGPAAGAQCGLIESADDLLNTGDLVTYSGDFSVAPGASVIVDDEDGTQGTFVDGKNAAIAGNNGDIVIRVTGNPLNVVGGDGVLSAMVCNSIVSTTGVSGDHADEAAAVSVLPNTGGSMFIAYGSVLVAAGVGLALVRRRSLGRS